MRPRLLALLLGGLLPASPSLAETPEAAACALHADWPCELLEELPAGRDQDNNELSVLHLRYGPEVGTGPGRPGCDPAEGYLLRLRGPGGGERLQPLYDFCNEGYGTAGVGEDRVRVGENRIRHERDGGSNWRWEEVWLRELSPQRLLFYGACGYHVFASAGEIDEWDFAARRARGWTLPLADTSWWPKDFDCSKSSTTRRYLALPLIVKEKGGEALARQVMEGRARLGSCSLELRPSGAEEEGFLLRGEADPKSPTRVRAVLLGTLLLVEVEAPERRPAVSANWIKDDRLELWLGENDGVYADDPDSVKRVQLGLRLADAALFLGRGEVAALPEVRQWQSEGARLFAFDVAELLPNPDYMESWGVTLIYGEGDGKRQGLMLASSRLEYDKAATFGQFRKFPYDCRLEGGGLEAGPLSPEWAEPSGESTL